ncbi:MAG: hypothetical protein ACKOX7_00195 [Bacteroidota bacterium]
MRLVHRGAATSPSGPCLRSRRGAVLLLPQKSERVGSQGSTQLGDASGGPHALMKGAARKFRNDAIAAMVRKQLAEEKPIVYFQVDFRCVIRACGAVVFSGERGRKSCAVC